MKVKVYGADLSAWVAAACLARSGNQVVIEGPDAVQTQPLEEIPAIRDEPGLLDQIEQQISSGRLIRSNDTSEQHSSDIHWLTFQPNERPAAEALVSKLSKTIPHNLLIINQCNFGVGFTDQLQNTLNDENNQAVVYIPDNLQQGKALQGFSQPKRIILGTDSDWALTMTRSLIRPYLENIEHLQVMTAREAEFTKFAVTGMLAIRLGYINELANLADEMNVDIDVIRDGMGADPRIGRHYLSPGCGFGGQNFSDYIARFSDIFEKRGKNSLLKTVISENEVQKELLFRKLWKHYQCNLNGKTVTLWGASFKPGTASIDNAPSLKLIEALLAQNVTVKIHDPEALDNIRSLFGDHPQLHICDNAYQAASLSDALLLVTEWPQYWSPDYDQLLSLMKTPLILDGRNIFDREALELYGFTYIGIGR
ncbi:MAG: nucleotide sugar dehydrogenase [Amphritea sp.]|nr:nucleotide sugar dehydrogenase [Amphritea sp.]